MVVGNPCWWVSQAGGSPVPGTHGSAGSTALPHPTSSPAATFPGTRKDLGSVVPHSSPLCLLQASGKGLNIPHWSRCLSWDLPACLLGCGRDPSLAGVAPQVVPCKTEASFLCAREANTHVNTPWRGSWRHYRGGYS